MTELLASNEVQTAGGEPVAAASAASTNKFRGRLFRKYAALFVGVVCMSLLVESGIDSWFAYRESRQALLRLQHQQADTAAVKIGNFIQSIVGQLRWTTQLRWAGDTIEQRRLDAFRLLHQVPSVTDLSQVDPTGHEQLRVSRLAMDVVGSDADFSNDAKFTDAVRQSAYYGPVYFRRGSEPYMTIAVSGSRRDEGVSVAEVNLKFIWDLVSQIKVGEHGYAYVVDKNGHLIAHPDISLVLRNVDLSTLPQVQTALSDGTRTSFGQVSTDIKDHSVLSAYAPIPPLGWYMFVELPRAEAFAPLYASVKRSLLLLAAGLCLAIVTAILMARKMVVPIRTLQAGVSRVAEGELGHQVDVHTGDEIEALADQFNTMSIELREGKAREEESAVCAVFSPHNLPT